MRAVKSGEIYESPLGLGYNVGWRWSVVTEQAHLISCLLEILVSSRLSPPPAFTDLMGIKRYVM